MSNVLSQAASILEGAAPTVASLFGGPLAGQAVALIESTLGLTPTGDKNLAATALLGATPDQIVALKKADADLKEKYLAAGVQIVQASAADRQSARQMQIETRSLLTPALALLIVLSAAATAVLFFSGYMTSTLQNQSVAALGGSIVGYVFAELRLVTSFYFGSSSGSESKNALIDKAMDTSPPATASGS